jgi:hypothetical protein
MFRFFEDMKGTSTCVKRTLCREVDPEKTDEEPEGWGVAGGDEDRSRGKGDGVTPRSKPEETKGTPNRKPKGKNTTASATQGAVVPSLDGKKGRGKGKKAEKGEEEAVGDDFAYAMEKKYLLKDANGCKELFLLPRQYLRYVFF